MVVLPSEYSYGKVVGRIVQAVADGSDADRYPDMIAASGNVIFKPKTRYKKTTDYSALVINQNIKTVLYAPKEGEFPRYPPGTLIDPQGAVGVWLVTGEYIVEFQLNEGLYPSLEITVTDDHVAGKPLDLMEYAPPSAPVGVAMVTVKLPPGGNPDETLVRADNDSLKWVSVDELVQNTNGGFNDRLRQLEVMGGISPGSVVDSQTAALIYSTSSETRIALGDTLHREIANVNGYAREAIDDVLESEVLGPLKGVADNIQAITAQRMPKAIEVPAGVGPTIPMSIYRTGNGDYTTDVDVEKLHTRRHPGPVLYVDPINGNDWDNDTPTRGRTPEDAYASPGYASIKNNGYWSEIIVINDGVFERNWNLRTMRDGQIFRALPGVRAEQIVGDILTWTQVGSTRAYTSSVAGAQGAVDGLNRDPYGDPAYLTVVDLADEVEYTPGSYHREGDVVTVRTIDDRPPDDNIFVLRSLATLTMPTTNTYNNYSIYIENIRFFGGTTASLNAQGSENYFYAKNCSFNGSFRDNGLSVRGFAGVVLDNCEANNNRFDGYNYHERDGNTGWFVEINCVGLRNGWVEGSQNGSSAHGSYRGVRVGGKYTDNLGGNAVDVNNTKTANIGITVGNSINYDYDFLSNGTSELWLDSCTSTSGRGIIVLDQAKVYKRDSLITGTIEGDVVDY